MLLGVTCLNIGFDLIGFDRPLINNSSGSGLLKKAIFPSSLAFLRRGHCFFLLLRISVGKSAYTVISISSASLRTLLKTSSQSEETVE